MSDKDPDKKREYHRRYRAANRAKENARTALWRASHPQLVAYNQQRNHAKRRGIPFLLSYAEWIEWWGEDYAQRGRGIDALCMARMGDTGSYELGNIYKTTNSQNGKDKSMSNQRVHVVSAGAHHWAISEVVCPSCKTMKGYPCVDLGDTSRQYLPDSTVHVARVKANGCNVLL